MVHPLRTAEGVRRRTCAQLGGSGVARIVGEDRLKTGFCVRVVAGPRGDFGPLDRSVEVGRIVLEELVVEVREIRGRQRIHVDAGGPLDDRLHLPALLQILEDGDEG